MKVIDIIEKVEKDLTYDHLTVMVGNQIHQLVIGEILLHLFDNVDDFHLSTS